MIHPSLFIFFFSLSLSVIKVALLKLISFFHNPSKTPLMNSASWPQEHIVVTPMEDTIPTTKPAHPSTCLERKLRPQKDQSLHCPRCNSTNTKFCYYNNYSLTQPRHFCKTCRRYWTEGGSLRNIPVGGGTRKNKRPPSNPNKPNSTNPSPQIHENSAQDSVFPSGSHLSAMEVLTGLSYVNSRGLNLASPFMGMPQIGNNYDPDSGFPSGFSLNADHGAQDLGNGDQQAESTGYWTGILGGATGSW